MPGELTGTAGRVRRGPRVPRPDAARDAESSGVVGSLVWDVIHGRDPAAPPVEEWGGIAYALGGLDAALPADWEIVPLIKVGRDLATAGGGVPARRCGGWRRGPGASRCPAPNNRVVLRYESAERRCERMSGGVPAWTWPELGPMVRDLDALYVNFISGFELCLGTAQALRQGFRGPIYADLHSLFLGMQHDGMRVLQPAARRGQPGSAASTWSRSTRTRCASSRPTRWRCRPAAGACARRAWPARCVR